MKDVIKYPLTTEKAVKLMESENKLLFVVDLKSTKKEIKEGIEKLFKVKVVRVNTLITSDGEKKSLCYTIKRKSSNGYYNTIGINVKWDTI